MARWITIAALTLVATTLVTAAGAGRAAACPCCGPCSKYDHMREVQPPVMVLAPVYVRERPAVVRRGNVMKVLSGARWMPQATGAQPLPPDPGRLPLRLIGLDAVPPAVAIQPTEWVLLVRNVIRRRGRQLIALDGTLYRVSRCVDEGRATTCLVRQPDAPTADDLVPGSGFAPPPP